MSHTAKAKAKGVSASSFFDLKAELSKQQAEFAKNKAAGKVSSQLVGGVKRPDKVSGEAETEVPTNQDQCYRNPQYGPVKTRALVLVHLGTFSSRKSANQPLSLLVQLWNVKPRYMTSFGRVNLVV